MASLHAFNHHSTAANPNLMSTMPIPVDRLEHHISQDTALAQKWTYLVANHIRFINKPLNSIRVNKPAQSDLAMWLEKIICNGQCDTLFVEQLWLDEITLQRIKQLCADHQVTLVNLTLNDSSTDNVIQGPW